MQAIRPSSFQALQFSSSICNLFVWVCRRIALSTERHSPSKLGEQMDGAFGDYSTTWSENIIHDSLGGAHNWSYSLPLCSPPSSLPLILPLGFPFLLVTVFFCPSSLIRILLLLPLPDCLPLSFAWAMCRGCNRQET